MAKQNNKPKEQQQQQQHQQKKPKQKRGRPTKYSNAIVDKLCDIIAKSSVGLRAILSEDNSLPAMTTIIRWLSEEDKEYFRVQYARAREAQAIMMADEIIAIADDGTNDYMTITKGDVEYNVENREVTSRSKLRVEARKWVAAKLLPKKYGDRIDLTTGDQPLPAIQIYIPERKKDAED